MARLLKFDLLGKFPQFSSVNALTLGSASIGAGIFTGIDDPTRFHLVNQAAIADDDDKPFFVMMAREGQSLRFDIDNANFDSRLTILDAKGNVLAENDNSGTTDSGSPAGRDPFLDFTAPTTGFYIVFVSSFDNTYQGNFLFSDHGTAFGSFQLDFSVGALASRVNLGPAANVFSDSSSTDHNIVADDGNDRVTLSGNSNDIVDGGTGNDTLNLGGGNDIGDGGTGDDQITGLAGNDVIDGGPGNDGLQGGIGNDQILGGTGNDTLVGDVGDDVLLGGPGDDILIPGLGDDYIDGGSGTNTISFIFSPNAVTIDLASGTASASISGTVSAREAATESGSGTASGEGADTFANIQNIYGTPYNDSLHGDEKANAIYGQNGDDSIYGEGGRDLLNGEGDKDEVFGGNGNDTISGGDGDDNLEGENGNDVMNGDANDDFMLGGNGDDTMNGGDGADSLAGGHGRDTLTGGPGKDIFGFIDVIGDSPAGALIGSECDTILDFTQGDDKISFNIVGHAQFIGTAAFSGTPREVAYFVDGSGDTHVIADFTGDAVADLEVVLKGTFALLASDFVL